MRLHDKIVYVISTAMSIAAMAIYIVLTPVPASADDCSGCIYASQCFSSGACIATCPDPNERQRCEGGGWLGCASC